MLTFLEAALWLTDRSPQLSHIPLLSVLSLVVPSWLRGCLRPLPVPAPALPSLGCRMASGVACACLRLGLGLRPSAVPLCASSSMPIYIRECVHPLCPGLDCCPVAWMPWLLGCAPLLSPSPLSPGHSASHCLPSVRMATWLRGSGVRGAPAGCRGWGVLTPGMSKPPSA